MGIQKLDFPFTSATQSKSNLGPGRAEVESSVFSKLSSVTLQNTASVKLGMGGSAEIQPLAKDLQSLGSDHSCYFLFIYLFFFCIF